MTKRKFYSDIQDAPQGGSGFAFGLLDANGNVIRGLAENAYVPRYANGLLVDNSSTSFAVTNPDSGLRTIGLNNGRCVISLDDRVGIDSLDVGGAQIDHLFLTYLEYDYQGYGDGQSIDLDLGMLCHIGNGGGDCTVTLPTPSIGKSLILAGFSSYTAPLVDRVTPALGSHIRYVNSANTEVIVAAGDYFSVKGRCVQLVAVSNIQWQLVGGYL